MRPNLVKEKWRNGQATIGGWCSIPSSYTAEVMGQQGFDWVCIDTQHGLIDYTSALPMLQAISISPTTMPFVRVGWNDPMQIMKYLDAGAYGLIVPMIETKEDAERVVWAARYSPMGMRSVGPARAVVYGGADYIEKSNEEVAIAVMIETPKALENLEGIASVEGIDALYIGPSDLSQALNLGLPYNANNPKHAEAVTRVRDVAIKYGKIPGIHTSGSALTNRYLEEGFKMILLTADSAGVALNARNELNAVKETFTKVNNGASARA